MVLILGRALGTTGNARIELRLTSCKTERLESRDTLDYFSSLSFFTFDVGIFMTINEVFYRMSFSYEAYMCFSL